MEESLLSFLTKKNLKKIIFFYTLMNFNFKHFFSSLESLIKIINYGIDIFEFKTVIVKINFLLLVPFFLISNHISHKCVFDLSSTS